MGSRSDVSGEKFEGHCVCEVLCVGETSECKCAQKAQQPGSQHPDP